MSSEIMKSTPSLAKVWSLTQDLLLYGTAANLSVCIPSQHRVYFHSQRASECVCSTPLELRNQGSFLLYFLKTSPASNLIEWKWVIISHTCNETGFKLPLTCAFCPFLLLQHISIVTKHIHIICGNKMPTRCNRGFYCRSYCLLNMFRASLCPSSGAQEYYTVVAACGILCCGFSSSWSGVELRVMRPVCRMLAFYFHILTTMHGQNQIKDCVFV